MKKKNIVLLYAIAFLQGMVFYASIATLYRQMCGLSVFLITVIESVSFVLSFLLEIPWGIIADKIGYKKTFVFCCILYAVSKVVFYASDCFALFLIERILLSVVCSGLSGVDMSILYLSCTKENSQKAIGYYYSFGTAGLLCASGIWALLQSDNYRLSAFLTVITYTVSAVLSLFITEVKESEECDEGKSLLKENLAVLKQVICDHRLLLISCSFALTGEVIHLVTNFINQVQYVRCGISVRLIPVIYIAATVCEMFSFLSDRITKLTGRKRLCLFLFITASACCVTMAFTKSAVLSVLMILIMVFTDSVVSPLYAQMENELIKSPNRATALSMLAIICDVDCVFVQLVLGRLTDYSISLSLLTAGAVCIVSMVMYLLSLKSVYNEGWRIKW